MVMVCPYNKTSYPASRRAPTRSSSYLGGESGEYNGLYKLYANGILTLIFRSLVAVF